MRASVSRDFGSALGVQGLRDRIPWHKCSGPRIRSGISIELRVGVLTAVGSANATTAMLSSTLDIPNLNLQNLQTSRQTLDPIPQLPRMLDRHFCLRSPPAGGQKIARKSRPRCKDMRYRIRSSHARYKPLKQIQEAGGPRGHWDAELSGFTVNSKCLNLQHPKTSEKLRKPLSAESEHHKDMKDPDKHI